MVRYPEYSNPGIYLSEKHSPPPWSRCPGSSTNPCPCCGSLWMSPPFEVHNNTPGFCLDSSCNCCCSRSPESLPNKDLTSYQRNVKEEQNNRRSHVRTEECNDGSISGEKGRPFSLSKSTQCNEGNPSTLSENDNKGFCQISCTQPCYQSEVSLPYFENQTCAICFSNMSNPPLNCANACCKFCPLHEKYNIPHSHIGLNCPFHSRPFCSFCVNPTCSHCVPSPNEVSQNPVNEKPTTADKSVLCKPEHTMVIIGGKLVRRERSMRNGLQDRF